MFVGWDWATQSHDVTVLTDEGGRRDRWAFVHSEEGIDAALARLRAHGDPAGLPVAIETSNGLVVDRLLAAGHPVVPIHPNAFNAVRPRWGAARAKSDAGDSFKLADYLRTDGHRLRLLQPTTPATLEIQALVRLRGEHVGARVAAVNQLGALLDAHWPGAKVIFADLASPIALTFLECYPTPEAAAKLSLAKMAAFCRRYSYCGHRSPADLVARLRAAPTPASRLSMPLVATLVTVQIRLVRAMITAVAELDVAIKAASAQHPATRLFCALPRIGQISLAQVIAEIAPLLQRADSCAHLCAEAGVAPVTRESGTARSVSFRYAVNRRARQALVLWADNSRHGSTWATEIYTRARQRGKRHPHAVRILARAWLRVIWACWSTSTPYDPALHAATTKSTPAKG